MYKRVGTIAIAGGLILTAAACGGGDDESATTTEPAVNTTPVVEPVTSTTEPAATTTTTTVAPMVFDGATVVVANLSIVSGAAGAMTDELGTAGFTTGTATNGTGEKLDASIVYYTADEGAQAVAETAALKLGGVQSAPIPDPIPTESGTLDGAQVLVLLGNDQAGKSLADLGVATAGGATTADTTVDGSAPASDAAAVSGLTVVVANASIVSGSAGAMSTELESAGYTVGTATNATGDKLQASVVYYTATEGAQADAEALAAALGGVEALPLPTPVPTESGELTGDILVLLGSDQAGKSLGDLT